MSISSGIRYERFKMFSVAQIFIETLLLVCVAFCTAVHSERTTVKDYCGFETFHPKCWGKEVIVMDTAVYGRRQVGRCIRASDVEELGERYIGCFTDVISLVDARCSGKHECEIRIPDSVLQQATKCPLQSLAMYMEAGYSCVEVVEEDRSCVVSVTSSPRHIGKSSASSSSPLQPFAGQYCGTRVQPWLLEAPAGQRIQVSLLDFASTTAISAASLTAEDVMTNDPSGKSYSSSSSTGGSCFHQRKRQFGYVIDKGAGVSSKKNVSICGGSGLQRLTNVYLSTSNVIELVLVSGDASVNNEQQFNFLLRFEATGCTDLVPPDDAWIKRQDDKIVIGCYSSRQTWQLRCHDGKWIGVVSNCTQAPASQLASGPTGDGSEKSKQADTDTYQILIIVAISFAGLAVCLTIVCCGIVCLRRFQVRHRLHKTGDQLNGEFAVQSNFNGGLLKS